ncbi:PTS sugar transporter subunit IIB [Chakrabartyella piscis]|uniref:PTS sugar transporter subunit IIB n=1 Tax=Chakrabartyella piscis TaxID=2918914 RepID=UPI0029588D4F|nr:PTS sugar transporter subunit IIB [Chakrabartyella piscis]
MKRILLCCGSGIATSTVAAKKLETKLNERGFAGKFTTTQCKVNEIASKIENFDIVVSTAVVSQNYGKPVVQGLPFLTGIGIDKVIDDIVAKLGLE